MIYICGYRDKIPENSIVINTTSKSNNWSRYLSPFFLGPCKLYDGYTSKNVENAWQYSKVYPEFVDNDNNPKKEYFEWAKNGWHKDFADRYPMGKGNVPLYSYWDGEKLGYINARKTIYIPIYKNAVIKKPAYNILKNLANNSDKDIYLLDFDGYNYIELGMSLDDVINNSNKKMGHAFVLALMLKQNL